MNNTQTDRVIKWNRDRNGLIFDPNLEMKMLSEEAREFWMSEDLAHKFQEYADFLFVSVGAFAKYHATQWSSFSQFALGVDGFNQMTEWIGRQEESMRDNLKALSEANGFNKFAFDQVKNFAIDAVIEANEAKPLAKEEGGKIPKGVFYKSPLERIQNKLEDLNG